MSGFDWLTCPHCRDPLSVDQRVAGCAQGHRFDLARQGYLNLMSGPAGANADTAEMVTRRAEFLAGGHYQPIVAAVVSAVGPLVAATRVLEVGAGTGYYLAGVLDRGDAQGLGLDISVPAAKRLARAHPRVRAVVADAWKPLPLAQGCVDVVLSIFAPRNVPEFDRVLDEGGVVVSVTPLPDHLAEARSAFGLMGIEADKDERLRSVMAPTFATQERLEVRSDLDLDADQAAALVGMGPNASHGKRADRGVRTTAAVAVTRWGRTALS